MFDHEYSDVVEQSGFAIIPGVLTAGEVTELIAAVSSVQGRGPGVRNLLSIPAVSELACSPDVRALVAPILGPGCFAVRGILFDKTPDAN